MLIITLSLIPALSSGQQWVGVGSQSQSSPKITFSESNPGTSGIQVEIPGFYLDLLQVGDNLYHSISIPDGVPILEQGNPELQKLSFNLQLQDNFYSGISVASSKYFEYTDINIPPSIGNQPRNRSNSLTEEGDSYHSDSFYPLNLAVSQIPYIIRNERFQTFQVYPFQYNPVTRVLRFYYEMELQLIANEGEDINPLSNSDKSIIQVGSLGNNCINEPAQTLKSGQLPSDKGSMLIICPEVFLASIKPLAEWRNQTGIQTEIIDAGQFKTPAEIYNFVKEYYYAKKNLAYLLLVGDSKHVPPFNLSTGSSDNSYSYLSGNDHYPDILVGRFSAESAKDVDIQVQRTIEYETGPKSSTGWHTVVTGLASTLSPGDDGESDFQHIRNLLKTMKSATFTQVNEFFDGSQGEADAEGNPTTSDITTKINQGTGIIFYAGHGSPNAWATGSITKSVAEGLSNTSKYPVIWSAACETGNFADKYCLAEAWLRASNSNGQPTGAVAAVMSSGTQTSFPPMQAQDKIAELLSDPAEDMCTMGAISIKGMMSMNDKYGSAGNTITDNWILFGDPALRIFTTEPQQLIVDHKGQIGAGRVFYTLASNSQNGFVCISKDGNILGTALIIDGKAIVYLDKPAQGESLTITVTAMNYIPYKSEIKVIFDPANPDFCIPPNHSRLQPINTQFNWECSEGGIPEYYLFYLGTDNPPTNMVNGEKLTSAHYKTLYNLSYDKSYYWKVVAVNGFGMSEGKIMEFRTVFSPDEDFESITKNQLAWIDGGVQKWTKDNQQFFDGAYSIRSGKVSAIESSSLIYPCEVINCDFVSFWAKTSCEAGDKLQFIVDNMVVDEWSGITSWSFHSYKIDPGQHQIEWRYIKDNNLEEGDDAVWIDNIHLPVHFPVTASVTAEGSVCEGAGFETSANADNYFYISWETGGDGTFNDINSENTIYKPGKLDLGNTSTYLKMKVHGFDGCPVLEKIVSLDIHPLPLIALPSDTIIAEEGEIFLDATIAGNNTYTWNPGGVTGPSIMIDSTNSIKGLKKIGVTVTSEKGCSATKEIQLHFNNSNFSDSYSIYPNPNNGVFTLEPVKGFAMLDQMTLFDGEGKVVWRNQGNLSIIGNLEISVGSIPSGTYYLVTENSDKREVNPVVIH
jgi:gingipain R